MPRALVTGATSGLGLQFSHQLAAEGYDLVLVARDGGRLDQVAAELSSTYASQTQVLIADLGTAEGVASVRALLTSTAVDFLVNNAGFGVPGAFPNSELADEEQMLAVNVGAVMSLTHTAVPLMIKRGHGDLINVASVAAFVPSDTGATYNASKAYVTAFTESLAASLVGTGVHASAVCPGFVHTEFHQRLAMDIAWIPSWAWLDAPAVVSTALRDHRAGKVRSVPSLKYKAVVVAVSRVLPRSLVRRIVVQGRARVAR